MNLRQIYSVLILATIFLGGCATVPVPQLARPESSGLGIVLKLRTPIGIFSATPNVIYFVKIDNEDGLLQQAIILSNYAKDDRFYFLNIRPGTYAAVAAFFARAAVPAGPPPPGISVSVGVGRTGYTTYFSKELVELAKVTVRENDFVFMGSYVVDQSVGLDGADRVQVHYKNVIAPGATSSGFLHLLSGDYHYRGTLIEHKNDEQTRSEFFGNAREDLAEGGWAARFK